mgnify:CR=1|jgi:hypothetical protein
MSEDHKQQLESHSGTSSTSCKFGFAGAILIIVSFLSPFEVLVTILDSDLF